MRFQPIVSWKKRATARSTPTINPPLRRIAPNAVRFDSACLDP
jgi:hypothetical protein